MNVKLQAEDGFTLIELLVSIVILATGIFALVSSVNASRQLGNVSEHQNVASAVADRELNALLTMPFNALALSATPLTSGSADDATWNAIYNGTNVSPSTGPIVPNPQAGSANDCSGAIIETLPNNENSSSCLVSCPTGTTITAGGCPIVPGKVAPYISVLVPAGSGTSVRLKVFRYITWVNDVACGSSCPNAPAGAKGDYKRITVAAQIVQPNTGSAPTQLGLGPARPIIVSAIRTDPQRSASNVPGNGTPCRIAGIDC
jgi:prepilin-type N-terminal cleavage/methylation domain-containing protein